MKLAGLMMGTENIKKLSDFYTNVLGEPSMHQGDWYGYWVEGGSGLMIGPHSDVRGTNDTPGRMILNYTSSDIKSEFARIKGLGAIVIAELYQPNKDQESMWMATFADPDGNYFQISTPWDM